jgi:HK97 family phage portal protein
MGLFSKMRRAVRNETLQEFLNGEDVAGQSLAGVFVSEENSMTVSAVFACVRVIAEDVASLPLSLYHKLDRGKEKADRHTLCYLIHDSPNADMTAFSFKEAMMTNLLLWGNAYAQIIRAKNGNIHSLIPLLSSRMIVTKDINGERVFTYTNDKGRTFRLDKSQILHIAGIGYDGLTGLSPISIAREAVGLAKATEIYGNKFFANGARPGGVLEHPGTLKDPERVRKSWEAVYKGAQNSHKVAVLEEGLKYHEIGVPQKDAQFLETRQFQLNEICRIFRVPPHLVGDLSKATFSNIDHQSIDYVVHTLRPWLVRWEQAINMQLLRDFEKGEYFAKFNVDGLLRGDFQTRMQGYAVGRQNGWYSANDIRELEDLNPISSEQGGDDYLVNGNMITAARAAKGGDTT